MDKLIITRWKGRILTALFSDQKAVSLSLENPAGESLLNRIYVGKVEKIVPNIQAAFIEIAPGQTGYLSLHENDPKPLNATEGRSLRPSDLVLVQVSRDAVKTKAPVLTSHLSFPGRYCVLTPDKPGINFSSKIRDNSQKARLGAAVKELLEEKGMKEAGVILRTNSAQGERSSICSELDELIRQYRQICAQAPYRTAGSCLYHSEPEYISSLRDASGGLEAVVTDQEDIFQRLQEYVNLHAPGALEKLQFYQDPLVGLSKVWSLERVMEEALGKRVWLKSGGYLVIEPTEAMTVIDVNTGKYSGRKTFRETILKINLEAAKEIARQLRLRNLSGIVVVDFIDMEQEEDQEILLQHLKEEVSKDPVKTTVVDLTRLNLVEITRKKIKRPLYEQINEVR